MLLYLIYLTIGWALFALLYWSFFRKETFFTANRFYLLGALAAGLVMPLFKNAVGSLEKMPVTATQVINLPEIVVGIQTNAPVYASVEMWLGGIWAAGAVWMLLRFAWGLRTIWAMNKNAEKSEQKDGIHYVFTEKALLPFSFFNRIFISPNTEDDAEIATMITHEKAHVHGFHSLDILFCEALCIIFWWNPLAHWYKNAIRTVHEYIADDETANQFSRKQYGLLLIRHAQSGPALALANHFFQSPLKQRLVMLTKHASAPANRLKYALILPALTLLFLFTQQSNISAQDTPKNAGNAIKTNKNEPVSLTEVDKVPEFPGGNSALVKFLSDNIKYPEAARKDKVQGIVVVEFVVNTEGRVEKATLLKKVREDIDNEALRVVNKTVWVPGSKGNERVSCKYTLPIKFKLD